MEIEGKFGRIVETKSGQGQKGPWENVEIKILHGDDSFMFLNVWNSDIIMAIRKMHEGEKAVFQYSIKGVEGTSKAGNPFHGNNLTLFGIKKIQYVTVANSYGNNNQQSYAAAPPTEEPATDEKKSTDDLSQEPPEENMPF